MATQTEAERARDTALHSVLMPTLLSIGHGFSARALAPILIRRGWRVIGTTRSPAKIGQLERQGVEPLIWPGSRLPIETATHLLTSVAPNDTGDPVL
ncbi:MAG: hypothetical protein AAF965_02085, partial [Pseudomonadota bacterium]